VKSVEQNARLRCFLFSDKGRNFDELKTLIGENDSSCSVDPRPCGDPSHKRGFEWRWARQNRDSRPISDYRIDDCWTCEQPLRRSTVRFTAQTTTHQWMLFITTSMDDPTTTTKRIEQNNHIVRSGKYEAEFTNNRRLSSTYYTIEANYWQTRSIARPLCDSRATCC